MESLPTILFQAREDKDMGDLEYLSRIANGELLTGVLKTFIGISSSSETIATVPGGKDWYLMGSSLVAPGVSNGTIQVNFGSTKIFDLENDNTNFKTVIQGEIKGIKITAGATIATIKGQSSSSKTTIQVLELDIGTSPKLT